MCGVQKDLSFLTRSLGTWIGDEGSKYRGRSRWGMVMNLGI